MNYEEEKILKTLTLMYIEDDLAIRTSVLKTLEMIFYDVKTFENAEDAFIQYKLKKPDIILSDINLPNLTGIEFSKLVRNNDYKIPIILLTAYTNKEILLEATSLKLVSYIVKPVVFNELYNAFKLALKDILRNGNNILKFANDTVYDLSTKLLHKNNQEVHITSSENRFISFLSSLTLWVFFDVSLPAIYSS